MQMYLFLVKGQIKIDDNMENSSLCIMDQRLKECMVSFICSIERILQTVAAKLTWTHNIYTYLSVLQTVFIHQELIDIHENHAIVVMIFFYWLLGDDKLREVVIDVPERTELLFSFFFGRKPQS